MTTTHYRWNPVTDNVLCEQNQNGVVTATYTHEPDEYGDLISQHRAGETSVYHFDGQGSTRALTDSTQNVTDTYVYDAWGEEVNRAGTTDNSFQWGGAFGYYRDPESSTYYIRARAYTPAFARWLSKDPAGFDGSQWNLYEYAENAPTAYVDASGLACWLCTKLVGVKAHTDAKGKVTACELTYKLDSAVATQSYAGTACDKNCQQVSECSDVPNITNLTVARFKEPERKRMGFELFKTPYCPAKTFYDARYCFGVNGKNCTGDFLGGFKNCTDLCRHGKPFEHLCRALPIGKLLCRKLVTGSVANCVYYCENQRLERIDEGQKAPFE